MQLGIYKADMCGTLPHWAAVFCHRVTQSQCRWSQGVSVGTPRGSSKFHQEIVTQLGSMPTWDPDLFAFKVTVTPRLVTMGSILFDLSLSLSLLFSLHFNGHFPGGPGLAGTRNVSILDCIAAKEDGGGGAIRRANLQSNRRHHQQTNTLLLQAICSSCCPTKVSKHWREQSYVNYHGNTWCMDRWITLQYPHSSPLQQQQAWKRKAEGERK